MRGYCACNRFLLFLVDGFFLGFAFNGRISLGHIEEAPFKSPSGLSARVLGSGLMSGYRHSFVSSSPQSDGVHIIDHAFPSHHASDPRPPYSETTPRLVENSPTPRSHSYSQADSPFRPRTNRTDHPGTSSTASIGPLVGQARFCCVACCCYHQIG